MYIDAVAALGHDWIATPFVHVPTVPRSEERRYSSALVPRGGGVADGVAVLELVTEGTGVTLAAGDDVGTVN